MNLIPVFFNFSSASAPKPNLSDTDLVIIFDGNSLTNGFDNSGITQYFPKAVQSWLTGKVISLDFASHGIDAQGLSTMIINAPSIIDPHINPLKKNVCVVWEDANDIFLNDFTGLQNYNNMILYVNARISAGFDYVIILGGYYPRTPYGPGVTQSDLDRQHDYFELLAGSTLGHVRIDLRTVANIGGVRDQAQNASYFNDYLHLQSLGYDEISSSVINDAILFIWQL